MTFPFRLALKDINEKDQAWSRCFMILDSSDFEKNRSSQFEKKT